MKIYTAKDEPISNRLGLVAALIIVVLNPLIFAPFDVDDAFSVWKASAFSAAVVVLLLAWLQTCRMEAGIILRVPYYLTPLIILGFAYVISTVLSVDILASLFGAYARYEGFFILIGYLLVGALLPAAINRRAVDAIISAWLSVGILVSAYAIAQYLGFDVVNWHASFEGSRVFSTLGNPLFLAGYIVLSLPVAYARIVSRRDILSIVFVALSVPALLLSYSRSGWLAFILVSLLFVAFAARRFWLERGARALRSPFIWAGVVAAVAVVASVVLFDDIWLRFASAFDWKSGTVASRFNLWELTFDIIKDRPVFGYGPETFLQISTRFLDLTQQSIEINTRYDRPHSDLLQVAFTTGAVGLLAYLTFVFTYLAGALRLALRTEDSGEALTVVGLALGVLGYLISIQFYFSTVTVTPLMWLAIGLTAVLAGTRTVRVRRVSLAVVAPIAVCLSVFMFIFLALGIGSDYVIQQAMSAEGRKDRTAAIRSAELAVRLSPWQPQYVLWQGQMLERLGETDRAIESYRRLMKMSPERYEAYAQLTMIYYDRNKRSGALNYAFQTLERYPLQYESRMVYALISAAGGDLKTAEENLLLLQRIDPNDYRGYLYLGLLYQDAQSNSNAKKFLKKALELRPNNVGAKRALAELGTATW